MRRERNAVGFIVSVNGEDVFSLDYDDAENYYINDSFCGITEVSLEKGLVTVYLSADKKEFNTIAFDCENRTAKMLDANCSPTRDCTYFGKISGSGTIICAPHGLTVTAKNGKFTPVPPITG